MANILLNNVQLNAVPFNEEESKSVKTKTLLIGHYSESDMDYL